MAVGIAGCSGPQSSTEGGGTTPNGEGDGSDSDGGESGDPASGSSSGSGGNADQPAACVAFDDNESDPLQRWIGAFPIQRGGAVLMFTGTVAEQMDVEASLEMAGMMGYEDIVCGTAVIVWVPGVTCDGAETSLGHRIEEGTSMSWSETACFRIDEVRNRIREECARGSIPAEHCP